MAKKKSTIATKKRKLDEIIAELPTKEELSSRLQPLIPTSEPLRLQLPSSLDLESPYASQPVYQRICVAVVHHLRNQASYRLALKIHLQIDQSALEEPGKAIKARRSSYAKASAKSRAYLLP
jgi:hypothetical protein